MWTIKNCHFSRNLSPLKDAVMGSDAVRSVMMGQRNIGGITTALPCRETGFDFEDDTPATMPPLNAKCCKCWWYLHQLTAMV